MQKNNPLFRTTIIILLVLTMLGLIRTVSFYYESKVFVLEYAKKEASLIKDYMMSMREVYQKEFLASEIVLSEKTIALLPAHASTKISNNFEATNKYNFYVKNVSDNPRNSKNMADNEELKAIEYFKENKAKEEYFKSYSSENKEFYQFATPIYIESYCLACHGKKEETPQIVQSLYNSAYDYEVGDLRGIVSIKIPEENITSMLNKFILEEILFILSSIIFIYLLLIYLYKRTNDHIKEIDETASTYALTDGLTGLYNRHYLKKYIDKNITINKESKINCVSFIDVDFFKKINDTYGHDIGDSMLIQISSLIKSNIRNEDVLFRYGGEEFLLMMIVSSKGDALKKLDSIRADIEKKEFICKGEKIKITISIGVDFIINNTSIEDSIKKADISLYEAKKTGRNKIVTSKESSLE